MALSSPRHIAAYLIALKRLLADATRQRHSFMREVGILMEESRQVGRAAVAQTAGRVGRDHGQAYRHLRAAADRLTPPVACVPCHGAVRGWLDAHVAACQAMADAGTAGDLRRLHETQRLLADGRHHARRVNAEYRQLADDVLRAARAARRSPARLPAAA